MSRIIASSLFASLTVCASAFAQLSVSPPALLPGDSAAAPAFGTQEFPAACRGGAQTLVVWSDKRVDPSGWQASAQSGFDIYAARYDADGNLLDATPILVTQAAADQSKPRVAWNGTQWLVAWSSQAIAGSIYAYGIEAARIATDGTVLDDPALVVAVDLGQAPSYFWDVASDGSNWTVFWTGFSGAQAQVRAARISSAGVLVDTTPKVIATTPGSPATPVNGRATFAGNRYFVVWSQWSSSGQDDIRGQFANASLSSIGGSFNVANHFDYEVTPAVATNGTDFYVVWDRYNPCCVGGASKVYGTRVTQAGAVLDGPTGDALYDTNGYGFQGVNPDVGWDGGQWVAVFREPETNGYFVNACRVSTAGAVLDFNGFAIDPVGPSQGTPALAALANGGSLAVWQDTRAGGSFAPTDIYAAKVHANGTATARGCASNGAPSQLSADVTGAPNDGSLIVFESRTSGQQRVLAQLTDSAGQPIGGPVEVAAGADVLNPNAAWNGSLWLIAWDTNTGVKARRFDAALSPIDVAPIHVMNGSRSDCAAQGDVFLVTALNNPTYYQFVEVYSRRVSASTGSVLDAASVLVGATYAIDQQVIAFDGGFLVTWQRNWSHDNPWCDVFLRKVSVNNVPGTQASTVSSSVYNQLPRVAASANTLMVTWHSGPSYQFAENVVARAYALDLTPLGSVFNVSTASYSQVAPSIAWDGDQFVVAWHDSRMAEGLHDHRTDVYAARVSELGTVLDPSGVVVADDLAPEAFTALAPLAQGSTLLAFSDFVVDAPFANYRVATSVLGIPEPWTDLGLGLAGSSGVPVFDGDGTLVANTPITLKLQNARPNAVSALVLGLSAVNAPFYGGVLVPTPQVVLAGLVTDGAGSWTLPGVWPAGVPTGFTVYFQVWIDDPAGPFGLAGSNAELATAP